MAQSYLCKTPVCGMNWKSPNATLIGLDLHLRVSLTDL